MDNKKIAEIFREIADVLEIGGENVFRIRSYKRAAQIVESFPRAMKDLVKKGPDELQKIQGIGKDLSHKIIEIVETGECKFHQDLLKSFKPDLLKMLEVRGLGPKKVKLFMLTLGIDSVAKLKNAAEKGQLRELEGMGEKSEAEVLKAIEEMEKHGGRMLLHEAIGTAEEVIGYMKKCKAVKNIEYAGSLRRMQETVGDLDILATASDHEAVFDYFVKFEDIDTVIARGDTKSSVLLKSGVQVDLRVVDEECFGAAMHYFTGSKRHNILIRGRAQRMGLKVSEYGVFKDEKMVAGRTEEELFEKLGLPYIPPEIRTDSGEIEAAEKGELPRLVQLKDIRGDLHTHSTWSDGTSSIEEMATAWRDAGYEYLAITDHSPSLSVANGLDAKQVQEKIIEIREVQRKFEDFRILMGTECDILADGKLDYPDEILEQMDVVVASVHNGFQISEAKQTERIIMAMKNSHVHIIGHLHGRMLGRREGYEVDTEAIMQAAIDYHVALEVNAQPLRLDITDSNCRLAKERGVKVVIGTDAHHHSQWEFMKFGVGVARRGWLDKGDVINTMTVENVLEWFEKKPFK